MELRKRTAQPKKTATRGAGEEDDGPVKDDSSQSDAHLSDSDSSTEEEGDPAEKPATSKRKCGGDRGAKSAAGAARRFCCPECPKSFHLEGHLLIHTKKHTGERRHVCKFPGCDFRAAVKSVMTSHERQHTGEKSYKCSFAGCTFAAELWAPLKMHERRHNGEKPYVCGIEGCSYRGIQRTALLSHITTNHPQNVYKDAVGF
ncbi:hypothetical protein RvY_01888 [Ramazzottius varieornatus]|uniref:C2H2-type domain-containing protein n=1 Tax=Ramazzottius varieornatus TaxID=947166 RepID=A0A1D1UHY9_RAMVA|nr:hypothetical protein RvY_01888 [Ramazzottius varieornatus]